MTYLEAVAYLESLINYERLTNYPYTSSMKLERMRRFLSEIGDPHERVPALHVAGSKGKGSTCAFLYAILRAAGYRVGLYTSPHLVEVRERMRVSEGDKAEGRRQEAERSRQGEAGDEPRATSHEPRAVGMVGVRRYDCAPDADWIGEEEFAELVAWLRPQAEAFATRSPWGSLTYFECLTAIAVEYFARRDVDIAVLEVGLGGRLDSTNVVTPLVCGITSLSLDHTTILGGTLEAIAAEKAGILKPGVSAVVASQPPEAEAVIERVAGEIGAPLWRIGAEVHWRDEGADDRSQRFGVRADGRAFDALDTTLLGAHQLENAAVAIGMIEALRRRGWRIGDEAVRRGVATTRWPGRLEVVRRRPTVVLDGAHSPASARALADGLRRHRMGRDVVLVVGAAADKDLVGILRPLATISRLVVATRADSPRAAPAARIVEAARTFGVPCLVTRHAQEAAAVALEAAGPEGTIVVTGSLYLVGEWKRLACGAPRASPWPPRSHVRGATSRSAVFPRPRPRLQTRGERADSVERIAMDVNHADSV